MTGLDAVSLILAANTAIGLACLVAACVKRSTAGILISLTMLVTPPAGTLYFLGGFITGRLLKKESGMRWEELSFSKDRRDRAIRPDVETEAEAVPFEEVLLASADAVKRSQLLMQLKKDHIESYVMIRKALDSDDPETSHYAASALTSAKAGFENTIRDMDSKYIKNSKDPTLIRAYADYVYGYLCSGILDTLEEKKYSYLYLNVITTVENPEAFLTDEDYAHIVDRAVFLEDFKLALRWAEAGHKLRATESSCLNLLKSYYYTGRSELFFETLDDMKKSDIALTEEGLSLVRFFAARQAGGR